LILKTIYSLFVLQLLIVVGLTQPTAQAQGQQTSILFTGVVTDNNSDKPLSKAYVLVRKAGRGTITNELGYFSLYVIPGDTVTFSYLGFKEQYHIIPKRTEDTYSAIIELREDAKLLQEVKVYPYRTEDEFKQAFLDMQLPDQRDREALAKNLDPAELQRMIASMGMSSASNYRYFLGQQLNAQTNRNFSPTIPFLNPFAWANFIRSVKRGDLKKKDWQDAFKDAPPENIKRSDFLRNRNGN
jgi:hypothetical protein